MPQHYYSTAAEGRGTQLKLSSSSSAAAAAAAS